MTTVVELARQLVAVESISPDDANCQDLVADYLESLGFSTQRIPSGNVSNLFARIGDKAPLFVFAGHTDVVAAGDTKLWQTPPFSLSELDNKLIGRGIADMKGAICAMMVACKNFLESKNDFNGSIGFLITSGEEGDDFLDGTPVVLDYLKQSQQTIDYCLVGEPSSVDRSGDMIKVGRRGSLTGTLSVNGKQGHVAYPHLAENAIHLTTHIATLLNSTIWDEGFEDFPATTLQITHFDADSHATNVIPGQAQIKFNFRFNPSQNVESLQAQVETVINQVTSNYQLDWRLNGEPFYTEGGDLLDAAIQACVDANPTLSTSGGTSDGRFIAKHCLEVIELGLPGKTIHQVNEHIAVGELERLVDIYDKILTTLL